MQKEKSIWKTTLYDFPASMVVFLVALPLCLGVALASGAPLISGIISGIIGGIVVGKLSKSHLSVSGPAAGLTAIVYTALQKLPSFEAFLLAVCLAGAIQIILSICKAGIIGDFIPYAVIKGMLTAIGLILILKQIPYAIGYNDALGSDLAFSPRGHYNTFTTIWISLRSYILPGAIVISICSLAFMGWWDNKQSKLKNRIWHCFPGPLIVVMFGIGINEVFKIWWPTLVIPADHLVAVPVIDSWPELIHEIHFPAFHLVFHYDIWITAFMLAIVASIESLLSVEAVDKLDPFKRVTPLSWELFAQGIGNIASGLIGGLPLTSVIVRSSANVSAGGRTKLSAILHGILLVLSVILIPRWLNKIPLSALASILIFVGYKLAKPQIFIKKFEMGYKQFIPFITTVIAILFTDLLMGVVIGVSVGVVFILLQNFRSSLLYVMDGQNCLVRLKKDFFFLHKYELRKTLSRIPDNVSVLLDASRASFIDPDNVEIIRDFITNAKYRGIKVTIKTNPESHIKGLALELLS